MSTTTDIVLVDDDEADLELIELALGAIDPSLTVHAFGDAEAAIETCDRLASDASRSTIVITDLNMPVMDGAQLIGELHRRHRSPLTCLVLSTSTREGDVDRCYDAGANAYHTKPMGFTETKDLCRCIVDYWLSAARLPSVVDN